MARIRFTKAEGAANDFVIVDDREARIPPERRAAFSQVSSDRRRGVGSDGTIFIDGSATHDFAMAFYNPDGSVGSMCGNGGRCAALYAADRGIAASPMRFDVLGRSYNAVVDGVRVSLSFPPPLHLEFGVHLELTAMPGTTPLALRAHLVHTGAPHLVLLSAELPALDSLPFDDLPVERLGRTLRNHMRFQPEGVNVNFLRVAKDGLLHLRTYEKGVEAETFACGTGTVAAALAAHALCGIAPPVRVRTRGGDTLTVDFTPRQESALDDPTHYADGLTLEGPAALVFDGEMEF
jgi:diaminopimelate epimerase